MEEEITDLTEDIEEIHWCPRATSLLEKDELIPIRTKSKNKLWSYFRLFRGTNCKAICLICGQELSYDNKAISAFRYHTNIVHNLLSEVEPLKRKKTINDYYSKSNQEDINKIVYSLLTNNNLPTTLLDMEEFKELLAAFNYKLPNRVAYNKFLEKQMEYSLLELKKLFKTSSCSLTADGWKSSSKTSYIGITARIVANDFHSFNIWGFLKPIYESTSENIEKSYISFKDRFEINKLNTITTDGAPNMCRSASNFLNKEGQRCFAHSSKLLI